MRFYQSGRSQHEALLPLVRVAAVTDICDGDVGPAPHEVPQPHFGSQSCQNSRALDSSEAPLGAVLAEDGPKLKQLQKCWRLCRQEVAQALSAEVPGQSRPDRAAVLKAKPLQADSQRWRLQAQKAAPEKRASTRATKKAKPENSLDVVDILPHWKHSFLKALKPGAQSVHSGPP